MPRLSSFKAFPAFMVAALNTAFAGIAVELFSIPLCINDKSPISLNILRELLLDAPSVPRHRFMPASFILHIGANPFPSFALLAGFVTTVAPLFFNISISSSTSCTQCARMVLSSKNPMSFRYLTGVTPLLFKQSLSSVRLSDRCVCLRSPRFFDSSSTCLYSFSDALYIACGERMILILSLPYSASSASASSKRKSPSAYKSSPTRPLPIKALIPHSSAALPDMHLYICISTYDVVPLLNISAKPSRFVQ